VAGFSSESCEGFCDTFSEDVDFLVFVFGSGSSFDLKIKNKQSCNLLQKQASFLITEGSPA
jgi:hypothetical protein